MVVGFGSGEAEEAWNFWCVGHVFNTEARRTRRFAEEISERLVDEAADSYFEAGNVEVEESKGLFSKAQVGEKLAFVLIQAWNGTWGFSGDGLGDGSDVLGGVTAAATGEVEEAGVGKPGDVVSHVPWLEIEPGGGERVGEAGVGIAGDVSGGDFGEVFEEGLH